MRATRTMTVDEASSGVPPEYGQRARRFWKYKNRIPPRYVRPTRQAAAENQRWPRAFARLAVLLGRQGLDPLRVGRVPSMFRRALIGRNFHARRDLSTLASAKKVPRL